MAAAPIAPITGMLKKAFFVQVGTALVGGYLAGSLFWYGIHVPGVKQRDSFYAKIQASKDSN
ncbi:Cytochrome c oxidase subunit 7A [Malassezia cuniculi]|uniref:Cytochrome c oxidase subunit 7A n=1 Tax=Malassezia cuniculi TaxID=948313 RepID=A0AAF0ERW6_9BASI|nr:Cytochrome c oxidase subunit 7A [Malassezia cuniculi]